MTVNDQRWSGGMSERCTICEQPDSQLFSSKILGRPGVKLCGYCFDAWYDGGRTDPIEICVHSLKDRQTQRREKMAAKFPCFEQGATG